jgi:hypothetical protein
MSFGGLGSCLGGVVQAVLDFALLPQPPCSAPLVTSA